ncbi:MAG: hypothetical protein JEZ08_09665 [Clostridiales bacterium]|nr:hypothetical protein [Clostridiales bacterium]
MTLEVIDQALNVSREALVKLKYDKRRLEELNKQYPQLEEKRQSARKQLEKENKDVERIAGVSLQSFVATILNNRTEKLEKEEYEAIEAKRVYDAITYELEELKSDMVHLKSSLNKQSEIEDAYQEAYQAKKNFIILENPKIWEAVQQLELKKADIDSGIKEIDEALQASRVVLKSTKSAISELKDAKSLGVLDMFGGGLLVTMAKRNHMSQAQAIINELNVSLKRFSEELGDVNMEMVNHIDIENYMSLGDYFFDGLFMDIMVQNKIDEALNRVQNLNNNVQSVQKNLATFKTDKIIKRKRVSDEMDAIVVRS